MKPNWHRLLLVLAGIGLFFSGAILTKLTEQPRIVHRTITDTLVMSASTYRDYLVAYEARRLGVPVQMAVAVSHAENWSGDPEAISSAGAVGLMQIMPNIWGDQFLEECYGPRSLTNPERNACVGVHVLQSYHEKTGNWNDALRAYNGSSTYRRLGDQYVVSVVERLDFEGTSF